jgi:leucyl aminopeptidase
MNFELKTLSLVAASKTSADTLIVLVDDKFQPGKDPVSKLIEAALAAKDLTHKAGKTLAAYRVAGISAPRICLVAVGDGHVAQIKTGLSAALPTLKSTGIARLLLLVFRPLCWRCLRVRTSTAVHNRSRLCAN